MYIYREREGESKIMRYEYIYIEREREIKRVGVFSGSIWIEFEVC